MPPVGKGQPRTARPGRGPAEAGRGRRVRAMKGVDFRNRYTIHLPRVAIADSKILANGMVPVTKASSQGLKDVIDLFGSYISREQHYDFPLGVPDEDKWKAYVFLTRRGNIGGNMQQPSGAAVFVWVPKAECRKPEDAFYFDRWWLMWAWLHPYERGKGVLSRAWQHFREEFGDFHLQPPVSKAMKHL